MLLAALLLLHHISGINCRPQGFSTEAFDFTTNPAHTTHLPNSPLPPEIQTGDWSSVAAAHPTGTSQVIQDEVDRPSGQSIIPTASASSAPPIGGASEPVTQNSYQPASPTHYDDHGLKELLQSAASDSTSTPSSSTGGFTSNKNEFIIESTIIEEDDTVTEAGVIPVYHANSYFVAEVNIGSSVVFLKLDTLSFHFWVVSPLLPEYCTVSLSTGAGCYDPGEGSEEVKVDGTYTFSYPGGVKASGKTVYADTITTEDFFGAAMWEKQIVALPDSLKNWNADAGITGVFPLGFNATQYYLVKAAEEGGSNATSAVMTELPLNIADWHFFTTYFKPGTQMFIGFNYEGADLYQGSLVSVPVLGINGSWSVMPESTWGSVTVGNSSNAAGGVSTMATESRATGTYTPIETSTPQESGAIASSASSESSSNITILATETPIQSNASGSEEPTTTAPEEPMATTGNKAPLNSGSSLWSGILALESEVATVGNLIASAAPDTNIAIETTAADVVKIKRDNNENVKRQSYLDSASTSTASSTGQFPILLDTGSAETYISATDVKTIYDALSGSCLTVDGGLHNCTYPCVYNFSSLSIMPAYETTVALAWGSGTTINIDMTQFASEVYNTCHPPVGSNSCSSTCRGTIQAQAPGREYYVYGSVVFKSAFFKWDTLENATVGMAPYADGNGGPWYYRRTRNSQAASSSWSSSLGSGTSAKAKAKSKLGSNGGFGGISL
ncbi:hypothetical protein TWF694_001920 [Orbilia ellipsospora]|uniref:Peptidase A1 domain-containing protein n=1 Tax=Orbilia ellipsospora TaxID=2528407 RepID=A0AAV9X4A1_9PEZI